MNLIGKAFLVTWTLLLNPSSGWVRKSGEQREDPSVFTIGVGIYDITGPAAEVNMMGYAKPSQVTEGIHTRLYARTFIIDDHLNKLVFVNADCGMAGQAVKTGVIRMLQEEYGSQYNHENVIISGTHTHSGPAGYLQYLLFDITSLGFVQETYDAMVEGIYRSIVMAHESRQSGRVFVSSGELLDASINRSPSAYENNPEEELEQYEYTTDTIMTVARFEDFDGEPLAMFSWFAVHPTSMNNTNHLISGDNKGYASQLFEKYMNPDDLPGKGSFVAAFAQANCGDISPNTDGPICIDTGNPCDILTSTCGGKVQMCIASGPGEDMFESTQIIGELQFEKALELFESEDATMLTGNVAFMHQYIDMDTYRVTLPNGTDVTTCKPALGYSFAAGTTDGPGALDFTQGMTTEDPFWDAVINFIKPIEEDQEKCHDPKPILLDTGNFNNPYPWHPHIIETQIGIIGQLIIPAVPGEFTTMAGRRFKEKMLEVAIEEELENPISVIAGLSNTYTHYITTIEEYAIQRYEGASTIYGPYTLDAYLQQYSLLLSAIAKGEDLEEGPTPPDLLDEQLSFLPRVFFDRPAEGSNFGDVVAQPYPLAYTGEVVIAKFVAGNPRNNVKLGETFLAIERQEDFANWKIVASDSSWETRFWWERYSTLLGTSEVTVYWNIPEDAAEGTYRIKHYGHYKSFYTGIVEEYEGTTNSFEVSKKPDSVRRDWKKRGKKPEKKRKKSKNIKKRKEKSHKKPKVSIRSVSM